MVSKKRVWHLGCCLALLGIALRRSALLGGNWYCLALLGLLGIAS